LVRLVGLKGADAEIGDARGTRAADDAATLVWDEADVKRETSVAAASLTGAAPLATALGLSVGGNGGASAPLTDLARVAGSAVGAALVRVKADADGVAETVEASEAVGALVVSLAGLRGSANDMRSADAGEAEVSGLAAVVATGFGVQVVAGAEVDGLADVVDADGSGRAGGVTVVAT
jgi:hypothetical protein